MQDFILSSNLFNLYIEKNHVKEVTNKIQVGVELGVRYNTSSIWMRLHLQTFCTEKKGQFL